MLYDLPKTHKPGTSLRPIVSFINSSTYQLSKHLVTILSPLPGTSDSHVQNSSDFAAFITSQTLGPDEILVLFDVVSLFTNDPVELAISVERTRLAQDTSLCDCMCLMANEVMMLLSFCLNATYCAFAGQFFKQSFGTAMGSPVSVTVANLVMEDVEERVLSIYSNPPRFLKRYVDITYTALSPDALPSVHHHLNSIKANIQFTIEHEHDQRLPFLNTEVIYHSDGTLSTKVNRKRTHTDKCLHFTSHHPIAHKLAVVRTPLSHAEKWCTSEDDKQQEIAR